MSAAPAPHDDTRRRELAAIHAAKKQLGLDDDAYRDLLAGVTGKRSAADLSAADRHRVIERMRDIGFQRKVATGSRSERPFVYHARKEHRLIAALWRNLWLLGEVEDGGPRALRWLAPEHAHAVVQALKDWLARAGFTLPSAPAKELKRAALRALAKAQWARLEAFGAIEFKDANHRENALDAWFTRRVTHRQMGIDHTMATAEELDRCAELLGQWLRKAKTAGSGGEPPAG